MVNSIGGNAFKINMGNGFSNLFTTAASIAAKAAEEQGDSPELSSEGREAAASKRFTLAGEGIALYTRDGKMASSSGGANALDHAAQNKKDAMEKAEKGISSEEDDEAKDAVEQQIEALKEKIEELQKQIQEMQSEPESEARNRELALLRTQLSLYQSQLAELTKGENGSGFDPGAGLKAKGASFNLEGHVGSSK